MPSRPAIVLIIAFWIATLGVIFYRDLWPRLAASGPPPIAVDLSDEATQFIPIKWKVLRGTAPIGQLTTTLAYQDADDTFEFTAKYRDLRIEVASLEITFPEVKTRNLVTRSGSLVEQSMKGQVKFGGLAAEAIVTGRNENGVFVGHCEIDSTLGKMKNDLPAIPVKDGQALNPLQPVNRILNIRPGQHWFVHEIDPLGEALKALFQEKFGKKGFGLLAGRNEPLEARVASAPETLAWGKSREEASCWVIEYRRGEARAKTWVRRSDGKVLRQEATLLEDRIALEREE